MQQTGKLLDLLEYYARIQKPASLAELSRELGWPRSSTFSLMQGLAERGFLYEPIAREGYYPSPRWQAVLQPIASAEPLPDVLLTLVRELSELTGETVAVGAPAGTIAVFIAVRESQAAIRYFAEVGHRVPIHASSTGRALLAQYPRAERMKLYRGIRFEQYHSTTPMSIDAIEGELRSAAERGWHQSLGEFTLDLVGVAVPLPFPERRLSLVVAGPSFRMLDKRAEIADQLRKSLAYHADELRGADPVRVRTSRQK